MLPAARPMGKISQALPTVKLLTCGPALLAALAPLLAALAAQPTDLAALVARRAAQAARAKLGENGGRRGRETRMYLPPRDFSCFSIAIAVR